MRAEHILARVREVGLGEIIAPREFSLDPVTRIHDPAFITFLENCWQEWAAAGTALAGAAPRLRREWRKGGAA